MSEDTLEVGAVEETPVVDAPKEGAPAEEPVEETVVEKSPE